MIIARTIRRRRRAAPASTPTAYMVEARSGRARDAVRGVLGPVDWDGALTLADLDAAQIARLNAIPNVTITEA
jgi:hypothetical protein